MGSLYKRCGGCGAASEVLSGSRGRKRKAVDIDAGTGPSETALGTRKLRKRA